jgi:ATP-dependent Clp protease adaptor protein ClpS
LNYWKWLSSPKEEQQFNVIVLDDDFHTFHYVIEVLCKLCGHGEQQALLLAKEVHETGRAAVWTGTLELAELKRDQIRGYGPDTYARQPVTFPLGCIVESLPA